MHSLDKLDENIEKIGKLFPNCITERKNENGEVEHAIDFDMLRQELSSVIVEGNEERYQFTWPDKKKSVLLANAPIAKTLRPCREESVDFDNTDNLYIEGDNLDVLKLLQETYLGKVKMIYIDPPYNTGNDFVYEDDFAQDTAEYLENSGQYDDEGNRLVKNLDSNGRFHTDWLNMMYPRLKLAKDLLTDDGVIFISCDDNEVENIKKIGNEIFGELNFVGQLSVINNLKGRNDKKNIATCHEYLIIFSKHNFVANGLPLTDDQKKAFNKVDNNGNAYQLRDLRKRGRPDRREDRPNMFFPIYYNEDTKECTLEPKENYISITPLRGDGSDGRWRWGKEKVSDNLAILEPKYSKATGKWSMEHRVYLNPTLNPIIKDDENDSDSAEERESKSKSFWMGGELSTDVARRTFKELMNDNSFDYPKSVHFIIKTLNMGTNTNSIVLDFFSGSATTAHAVMKLNAEDGGNRKFIMVQLPEETDKKSEAYKAGYRNICEIGKERIRRAGNKISEENPDAEFDKGFRVLKCESSNMKDVFYNPVEYEPDLLDSLKDNIKDDRTPEDLLFQVMLDLGILLSEDIQETMIEGMKVFNVADNFLIACFDENITNKTVEAIAKKKPYYFVMRDKSVAGDNVISNFDQIFATYSPDTVRKVL